MVVAVNEGMCILLPDSRQGELKVFAKDLTEAVESATGKSCLGYVGSTCLGLLVSRTTGGPLAMIWCGRQAASCPWLCSVAAHKCCSCGPFQPVECSCPVLSSGRPALC